MGKSLEEQLGALFKKGELPDAPTESPKEERVKAAAAIRPTISQISSPKPGSNPDAFNKKILDMFPDYYEVDSIGNTLPTRSRDQIEQARLLVIGDSLPNNKIIDLHGIKDYHDLEGTLRYHINRFRPTKRPEDRVIAFVPGGGPGRKLWDLVRDELEALNIEGLIFPAKYRTKSNPGVFYVQIQRSK